MIKKLTSLTRHLKYAAIRKAGTSTSTTTVIPTSSTTIYSVASGFNQRCSVAVVRLSGKHCLDVLHRLIANRQAAKIDAFEPRKMYLKDIWHPISKEKIDKCLIVWFKEPHSFTGEDILEFHVHGGPSVITTLINALSSFDSLRQAEPGEFSRRAFLNGKMDLVEIEGLVDLVNAETEMQRKQALQQMEGSLSSLYKIWRESIIKCLANVEAFIDFNEEENVEDGVLNEVEIKLKQLVESIHLHLNDNRKGERLRSGVRVVIIGQPNAGKSSLLNAICKRPAAIVSAIPGTTRDVIETGLNIAGYPVLLSDTAGLRETSDLIEVEGVKRAFEKIDTADILIIVVDLKKYFESIRNQGVYKFLKDHLSQEMNIKMDQITFDKWIQQRLIIISLNKKDLISASEKEVIDKKLDEFNETALKKHISINRISSIAGSNDIDELLDQLKYNLSNLCSNAMSEMPSLTQERHRDNLIKCVQSIESYLEKAEKINTTSSIEYDAALIAEELRQAVRWLGYITGHVTTEQILDVIFRDFCIGK